MELTPPQGAFARLQDAWVAMDAATTFDQLQWRWEEYLVAHQRVWNRCCATYHREPWWAAIQRRYARERTTDISLIFLQQARHAEEHGIDPSSRTQHGHIAFSGTGHIRGVRIVNGQVELDASPNVRISFEPSRVLPVSVTNRGQTYHPPKSEDHKDGIPVLSIAATGVDFYSRMFKEIDVAQGLSETATHDLVQPYTFHVRHFPGAPLPYVIEMRPRDGFWSPALLGVKAEEVQLVDAKICGGAAGICTGPPERSAADGPFVNASTGLHIYRLSELITPAYSLFAYCKLAPSMAWFGPGFGRQFRVDISQELNTS